MEVILIVSCCLSFVALVFQIASTKFLDNVVDQLKNNKGIKVELNPFIEQKDLTTVLPLPVGAITCKHDFEKVSEQVLDAGGRKTYICILKCPLCGAIDKTVTTAEPPPALPPPPIPRSECNHRWDEKRAVTLASAFEQIQEMVASTHTAYDDVQGEPLDRWAFQKTYVKERICTKCGEINVVKATNFEAEPSEAE